MFSTSATCSMEDGRAMYAEFLSDFWRFTHGLDRVLREWPISCEQFLSNENINRIAWLGQASMFISTGIPAKFRSGFMLLSESGQAQANTIAEHYLRKWLKKNRRKVQKPSMREARRPSSGIHRKIDWWLNWWERRGYGDGIPEEVPTELVEKNLAPSYKAICLAILSNDVALQTIGFTPKPTPWYGILKRIELNVRAVSHVSHA